MRILFVLLLCFSSLLCVSASVPEQITFRWCSGTKSYAAQGNSYISWRSHEDASGSVFRFHLCSVQKWDLAHLNAFRFRAGYTSLEMPLCRNHVDCVRAASVRQSATGLFCLDLEIPWEVPVSHLAVQRQNGEDPSTDHHIHILQNGREVVQFCDPD